MQVKLLPIIGISLLLVPAISLADTFNPNILISDARFIDVATLGGGAEGIQKFLEAHGSVLANTSPDFLLKLREPGDVNLKSRLPDPRPNLGRLRTAAELIYEAAISAGINPQVVLVTLQKEQSLVDGKFFTNTSLQRALDRSLGFGCPDDGGCGELFLGFYHQLFGNFDSAGDRYIGMAASLARSFYFEVGGVRVGRGPILSGRTARVGDVVTLDNTQGPPNNAPAQQIVSLSNYATAALYRYTPHVYNGNYNFSRFFTAWFKYANGTLLRVPGEKIYVIDNGLKRQISRLVISQRGLDLAGLVPVSTTELSEYPAGDVMPPVEGTLLTNSASQMFLIEDSSRKAISSFVAVQRKLNPAAAIIVPDDEIASYRDGGRALPAEGTLVKSRDNPAVFIITNNEKRLLSAFVFKQRGLKFSSVLSAEPGELDGYPQGRLMTPFDGTLVKSSGGPAVYHIGNGKLEPLTLFVFNQRKFSFRNVVTVPASELAEWEIAKPMAPETGVLVKANSSPAVYYVESGVKRPLSYDVFIANRFSFKNVLVGPDAEIDLIEIGDPLALPERALVKIKSNAAVYYIVDGVLRPLTLKAFNNRLLRFEDVVTISDIELAKYQVGAVVEN
ncbi:MAG: hypothetical protein A2751_05175 [Candidatus Doudnabacteria bacterium RIFCSPHIGHO2_01_FULL_46_14]|uniref:Uncharacterized protein n=1 Tax=Candidatus Doudnabacteria bacterium RIFCSPHIGHO2_01_FULL_46_14 TaxID=1817824 RepID=A0A1F5NNY4_9BACT|nr:MAG: hypothetical protein A2751_05175 [Candidatus Doudnabacteria bacterium RIFCSPHIGHO2_01_FULL_46_14]